MFNISADKYTYHRTLGLDRRVGALNLSILATQKVDPRKPASYTKPHLAARVVRKFLTRVNQIKACKHWTVSVFRKLSGRPPRLPLRDASPIDLEMAVNGLHASEMPWMASFRKSLNCTFGPKVTESMLREIDDIEMWVI